MMGVFALVDGFIRSKVPLIVLRALMGAGILVPSLFVNKRLIVVCRRSIDTARGSASDCSHVP